MELKEPVPLGTAPPLPPHDPADMLNLFMTRYDYDYCREAADDGSRSGDGGERNDGDGISGAVRNRPIFAQHTRGKLEGPTIYQRDYTPPKRGLPMETIVAAALGAVASGEEGEGVFAREHFICPGTVRLDADDISTYMADYTGGAADGSGAAGAFAAFTASQKGDGGDGGAPSAVLYAGAASVPYKADFLTVKGGAVEDDGSDIVPKITDRESLKLRHPRLGCEGDEAKRPSASPAAAARYLMSNACPPWVPDSAFAASPDATADSAPALYPDGEYGPYSCESWRYGDTSCAHPCQLPQNLAGSLKEDLVHTRGPGDTDTAALLRRLAGQALPSTAGDKRTGTLSLFTGRANDGQDDETNPIFLTQHEQRSAASRHRLEDEGFVKGRTMYQSDYINQQRLPELPGGPAGDAHPRDTRTDATATPGAMGAGHLTAQSRAGAVLRNSHGTLLPNSVLAARRTEKLQSALATGKSTAAAVASVAAAMPAQSMINTMRAEERHDAVDKADPHRHKLH